jgi:hypothetical protein
MLSCAGSTRYVVFTPNAYYTPYTLNFTFPTSLLLTDLTTFPRNDPTQQAIVPYSQWYDTATIGYYGPQVL